MYYLFKYKNILPSSFYVMKSGEKKILHAFVMKENEDARKGQDNFV
ncbi:hypothetical protein G8V06_09515 [Clostridium botulinum D/C]|nr:hypothetical protein [Clostridium botulinum]MCD3234328.1 hypothetical protein [Clostridium botulinum D/C]MCD3240312.1 hypothetical protein [Clostridium botulinum D/C]MCD3267747.1 hypothetical protein [Clostridium botulinum D/C]MCD3306144.1 hypothetical protein [Clostridium botulinum D/C]MCD3314928.1 hypothetical protein [Clostridium botulinum D/C]